MWPAVEPTLSTSRAPIRMAKGVTIPKRTTGGTNKTTEAAKEPITAPVDTESMPLMVTSKKGRSTKGIMAMTIAPASTITPSKRGLGRRSAHLPPIT